MLATFTLALSLVAAAHAEGLFAPSGPRVPDESSGIASASSQTNNVPNPKVIELLTRKFDEARMPLATGDLRLETRWQCREFFTEASGYSSYRFRSLSFRLAEDGIIEDSLNSSPRFYVFTRTALVGDATEIRVDHRGNLRIASRGATGAVKSYTVCLAENRTAH